MSTPFTKALTAIDAAHALDPNKVSHTGVPYELHYAEKCTRYLFLLNPSPSEPLQLAIRAQHFRRWEVPRASYPMTKAGYYAWRTFLKKRQGEMAKSICLEAGFGKGEAEMVASLINKEGLVVKKDSGARDGEVDVQVLEDVACLVFLDDQFEEFESGMGDEEKVVNIIRKTWGKMSERGHELALKIPMSERSKTLIGKALEGS